MNTHTRKLSFGLVASIMLLAGLAVGIDGAPELEDQPDKGAATRKCGWTLPGAARLRNIARNLGNRRAQPWPSQQRLMS